jgi:hypothetical protein
MKMSNPWNERERREPTPLVGDDVRSIYRDNYAARYAELYVSPWLRKHERNARNLEIVLEGLPARSPRWLDLACGQAWHFSAFQGRARMLGLDISEAQLARARVSVPGAEFLCADMTQVRLPPASFDLVTNFWGGYCYLRSRARIAALWRTAIDWIAPGGALYLEVLLGRDLESFNRSHFSRQTGFAVAPRSDDYSEWEYEDIGGRHVMTSPPVEEFLDIITPAFHTIDARHDGAFMVHLVATGRR